MHFELKRVALLLLLLIGIFMIFGYYKIFLKLIYPFFYQDLIYEAGAKNDVDPYLVAAIIYVESKFNSYATSNRGARGLMQIMPETGRWIAQRKNDEPFSQERLYDPKTNIKYGCWYLGWLKDKFEARLPVMLAAYNGGHGNVGTWIRENTWDGKEENISQIPLSETRGYVNKVIKVYNRYQYIYK